MRNIRDRVPRTIGYFLVQQCQDKIQFKLFNERDNMENVVGEHPAITEERSILKRKLDILIHSSKVLQRDPEL